MSGSTQLSPEQGGTENFVLNKQILAEVMFVPLPGVVQAESDRGEGGHRDFFLLRYHSHKVKLTLYLFKKIFYCTFCMD